MSIEIRNDKWFGRWRENGKSCSKVFRPVTTEDRKNRDRATKEPRIPADVQAEMDAIHAVISGPERHSYLLTITDLVESKYFPDAAKVLRPSSIANYRCIWNIHLKTRIGKRYVRDFSRVDAFNLWEAIRRDNPTFRRRTLMQIKSFVKAVFSWALNRGFADGLNPGLADLPEGLPGNKVTEAYSIEEINAILGKCIDAKLAAVLAVLFGSGNRVSEVRGLTWENYERLQDGNGAMLHICQQYTRHGVQPLKTEKSAGDIPLDEPFCTYIDAYRATLPAGADSGYMFAGNRPGKPMQMYWFAISRIKPLLTAAGIPWRGGFHAFRRGNSTFVAKALGSDTAAALSRHTAEIAEAHYIKTNDQERRGAQASKVASIADKRSQMVKDAARALGSKISPAGLLN